MAVPVPEDQRHCSVGFCSLYGIAQIIAAEYDQDSRDLALQSAVRGSNPRIVRKGYRHQK
jgi:hypothetical protein